MKTNIYRNEGSIVLQATDGLRRVYRTGDHKLWGELITRNNVIGEMVTRPLTAAETAKYAGFRRAEKAMLVKAKADKVKAEVLAAEKAARQQKLADEKAARKAAEAERAELRALRDAIRKMEAEEAGKAEAATMKKAAEDRPTTEKEMAVKVITDRVVILRSLVDAITSKVDDLWMELQGLRGVAKFYDDYAKELTWDMMDILGDDLGSVVEDICDKAEAARNRQADIPCVIADLKAMKTGAVAEMKALKNVLTEMAKNAVDAPFVVALADKIRERKPKNPDAEIREAAKIPEKASTPSYRARTLKGDVLFAPMKANVNAMGFTPEFDEDMVLGYGRSVEALKEQSRATLDSCIEAKEAMLRKFYGWTTEDGQHVKGLRESTSCVSFKDTTIIHLPQTLLSQVLEFETGAIAVNANVLVIDHGTEEFFRNGYHWMVWGKNEAEAEKAFAKFVEDVYNWLEQKGAQLAKTIFRTHTAGSSQLKDEKVVMFNAKLRKSIEEVLYFGKTEEQFAAENPIVGPELWKAWANMSRPWTCDLQYADNTIARPRDILVVKSPKYMYHHGKAIQIGELRDGKIYRIGPADKENDIFAGQIFFWKELRGQGGQLNGWGLKGFGFFGGNRVLRRFLEKNHMTMEEFLDCTIENIDGKMVRIGDYAGIATDDIWKFDKFFPSYEAYLKTVDRLSAKYPVIGKLGILRQSEDEEGQYKRRHMTRSLFQQLFHWTTEEVTKLVKPSAAKIKALMTYEGAIKRLAGLSKDKAERTPVELLFGVAPWLFAAPAVQAHWKAKLRELVRELMANKLDAKGQYPYIVQDPVAMLEVLVLGMKPEDAGVLPKGCISVADVPDGAEVLALRFPANFLTARVLVNRAMSEIFVDLGNVCVLSIHDDILIVQDGDTDGDEMCILYGLLIIDLVKRMLKEIDPPVVLFKHGSKATPVLCGNVVELRRKQAHARYIASHNDHTGIYADLARDCAWLAAVALAEGDMETFEEYLVWMAIASTGAIISIDQVKGTDVDENLEAELKDIKKKVARAMGYKKPNTQQFLKKNVSTKDCNKANPEVLTDAIVIEVRDQIGPYDMAKATAPFAAPEVQSKDRTLCWNEASRKAAIKACFVSTVSTAIVQNHALTEPIKDFVRNSVYATPVFINENGVQVEVDKSFRENWESGEISLKELIEYLYHNERALMNACKGALYAEKRQEYYAQCWKLLREFALTDNKPGKTGVVKDANVKVNSLYRTLVNEALELERGNGNTDQNKGYNWFVLNVIAAPLAATIQRNGWNPADFMSAAQPAPKDFETALEEDAELFGPDELEFDNFQETFGFSDEELAADCCWLDDELVAC